MDNNITNEEPQRSRLKNSAEKITRGTGQERVWITRLGCPKCSYFYERYEEDGHHREFLAISNLVEHIKSCHHTQ